MEAKVSTVNASARSARSPSSFPELETTELRQKILEMTALCKQLQDHVEYLENKMTFSGSEMASSSGSQAEAKSNDSSNSSELTMLKEKLKELVAMNMNWQRHNTQQEKKIREQNEKIDRLEKELSMMRSSGGQLPESQQIEFDQILLAKKHLCNSLEEEKTRIEEENQHLKQKVQSLQTQQEGLASTLSEMQERCQLLETQLLMYQEDFKTERSDRERAQSKNADLEMLVADLQKQLIPHSESSRASSRFSPHDTFSARLPHQASHHQPHGELRGRGINVYQTDSPGDVRSMLSLHELPSASQYDRGYGVFQTDGRDESDAYQVVIAEDLPNYRNTVPAVDELSCPNCRRGFQRNQHLDLLEHMEVCN
jgi:hypothetical protein